MLKRLILVLALILPTSLWAETITEMVNGLRAQAGLGPVTLQAELQAASEAHARDMARHGYFSHQGRNGATHADRAKRAGYRFRYLSENIAQNQPTLNAVLATWMSSPAHRKNILNRSARDFGLAVAKDTQGRTYWVMMLGRER